MRLAAGILALGTAVTTGAGAGDLVLANGGEAIRFVTFAGTGTLAALAANASDQIVLGPSAHVVPAGTADTVALLAATQTLTNKTILAPSNTVAGVLDRDVVTADVVNTTVETVVYSFSVPGGTLGTNRALRLTLIGDYLNNSGGVASFTLRLKYGGTTLTPATTFPGAKSNNANRYQMAFEAILSANNATNAQVAFFRLDHAGTSTAGAPPSAVSTSPISAVYNALAIDSTLAQTLEVTFQHDTANANISGRALAVQVEVLR